MPPCSNRSVFCSPVCPSWHNGILILFSKRFLFCKQKNQPSPHATPRVCRHAQTGQSSAYLRVRAYRDLDSHFKVVSVPATEREPTFTSCHPSSMPPLVMSNQRFFKIVCFRFPTNVPQKIEYIRF